MTRVFWVHESRLMCVLYGSGDRRESGGPARWQPAGAEQQAPQMLCPHCHSPALGDSFVKHRSPSTLELQGYSFQTCGRSWGKAWRWLAWTSLAGMRKSRLLFAQVVWLVLKEIKQSWNNCLSENIFSGSTSWLWFCNSHSMDSLNLALNPLCCVYSLWPPETEVDFNGQPCLVCVLQ